VAFTSYALPTIIGALKRHFRDTTWRVRMPRRIQDLAVSLGTANAYLSQQFGRTPTSTELAAHLGATEDDVAVAGRSWQFRHPDSLDWLSALGGEDRRAVNQSNRNRRCPPRRGHRPAHPATVTGRAARSGPTHPRHAVLRRPDPG